MCQGARYTWPSEEAAMDRRRGWRPRVGNAGDCGMDPLEMTCLNDQSPHALACCRSHIAAAKNGSLGAGADGRRRRPQAFSKRALFEQVLEQLTHLSDRFAKALSVLSARGRFLKPRFPSEPAARRRPWASADNSSHTFSSSGTAAAVNSCASPKPVSRQGRSTSRA